MLHLYALVRNPAELPAAFGLDEAPLRAFPVDGEVDAPVVEGEAGEGDFFGCLRALHELLDFFFLLLVELVHGVARPEPKHSWKRLVTDFVILLNQSSD